MADYIGNANLPQTLWASKPHFVGAFVSARGALLPPFFSGLFSLSFFSLVFSEGLDGLLISPCS